MKKKTNHTQTHKIIMAPTQNISTKTNKKNEMQMLFKQNSKEKNCWKQGWRMCVQKFVDK